MTELIPKSKQLSLPGFRCSRNGLQPNKGLTREQWVETGHALFAIEGCLAWYIGDWLAASKGEVWGYGDLSKLCEEHGWNYGTAMTCKSVSDAFEFSLRNENLSFHHHRLAQGPGQAELLQWASENNATTSELRHEKRKRRHLHLQTPDKPGVGNIQVLLADPPWMYDFAETTNREVENHYPTATPEEIGEHLSAWGPELADDCVLFLWATAPKLREAFIVMDAWGFEYKTHAAWDKERMGMGYWFRGQHELLFVGTRGTFSPPVAEARVSSVFRERRNNKHSKKPVCVYEAIERMFPNATKYEMYQREPRDGWLGGGNES